LSNTGPESVNAATGPAPTTGPPVTQAQTTSLLTILGNVVDFITNPQPQTAAQILGLWTAARAAVSTVASGIAAAATQSAVDQAMAKYTPVKISPADLADMVIRNILPTPAGAASTLPTGYPGPLLTNIDGNTPAQEAALSGMNSQRFDALVLDNGESYGIIDALRLYNLYGNIPNWEYVATTASPTPLYASTGDLSSTYAIDDTELYKVIAYSRVRPQFTDDLLKLRYRPISPAEAVELAVKEIVSVEDATALYKAAGGIPEQFNLLYRGAGDAAGLEHAAELLAEGVINQGRMEQIIGMSRLNPAFYDLYLPDSNGNIPMHQKWLPPFELQRAVVAGLMDQADAITAMQQQGYTEKQATLFFNAAQLERVISIRGVTENQVMTDWQAGLISQADAETALKNIGYQDWALPIIFDVYEGRRIMAARNQVAARVRSSILAGGVDSATAVTDLTSIGYSSTAANQMVADWTIEANTPNKMMPYTVVGYLLEAQLMGTDDGVNYFRRSGYTEQDAQLMVSYYTSGLGSQKATVADVAGPVTREAATPIPEPPTRIGITELGPPAT
jgi:hypothetical protein